MCGYARRASSSHDVEESMPTHVRAIAPISPWSVFDPQKHRAGLSAPGVLWHKRAVPRMPCFVQKDGGRFGRTATLGQEQELGAQS